MDKKTEYEALREEILCSMQIVKNYRIVLYSIVSATLAFAFDKNIPMLFLVPFISIIPFYLLAMHQIDSTIRMGAYIYVFLEKDTECQWETRLYKYDFLHRNEYSTKKSNITPYWLTSLCCLALCTSKLDFFYRTLSFYITIAIELAIFITCIYIFIKKRPNYLKIKEKYIKEWKEIQVLERKA